MRTAVDVEEFKVEQERGRQRCASCAGLNNACACAIEARIHVNAYEACVPKDFWDVDEKKVKHNNAAFQSVVKPYVEKLRTARRHGYGVMFLGDNGVGKTMFMSYILMEAIRRGLTAYYTTMPQLDYHVKRGFNSDATTERLQYMLTSDFLAVDEMGKERFKDGDTYTRMQLERILKQRFDDSLPVLLATNMDYNAMREVYGNTLTSIIQGKYQLASMEPGDFRGNIQRGMVRKMGYK